MSSSFKRELSLKTEHPEPNKKTKLNETEKPLSSISEINQRVVLNPADCDLDFIIEANGLHGCALHEEGFAYCWSGARANVGISGGKYCFSCKVISAQSVAMEDTPPEQRHVCRLGISRGDDAVSNLGETEHSFGFGGTGKFSAGGKFSDYGEKFGVGDTIVCAVNLEDKPLSSIEFWKNGRSLGRAKLFDAGTRGLGVADSPRRELQWESALFPHILLKNVVVEVKFSLEDGLVPIEGYEPWACSLKNGHAIMGPTFSNPTDCEVMMMVGLPASGKTTWAEKWVKEHPEKRYVLLGTNLVLDQMKVPGLLRKHNYGERFDRLMDRATAIFNVLLSKASSTYRNYIIDQTNVYKSARKRKLRPFACFRKVAVVVFTTPDELKNRANKRFREMGKEVPADAVNGMIANFILPTSKDMRGSDEFFDEVWFPELNREDSERYLGEMKALVHNSVATKSASSMPPPNYGYYQQPNQCARPYGRSGLYPEAYQVNQICSPPRPVAPFLANQNPGLPRACAAYGVGQRELVPQAITSYETRPTYTSLPSPGHNFRSIPGYKSADVGGLNTGGLYETTPSYRSHHPPIYNIAHAADSNPHLHYGVSNPYDSDVIGGVSHGAAPPPYHSGIVEPSSVGIVRRPVRPSGYPQYPRFPN